MICIGRPQLMTAIIKGESPEHLRVCDPRGAAGGWFVLKDRDATRSLSERKREKVGFIETMGFTQYATPRVEIKNSKEETLKIWSQSRRNLEKFAYKTTRIPVESLALRCALRCES